MTAPKRERAPLFAYDGPQPRDRAPRISRRTALAVAGAAVGVLGVGWLADGLATLPLSPATKGPLTVQVGLYHVTLALQPAPPRAGAPSHATLTVRAADGAPVSGLAVEVLATMTEMAMMYPGQHAAEQPDHQSYACSLVFAMSGAWQVQARASSLAVQAFTATFDVVVG